MREEDPESLGAEWKRAGLLDEADMKAPHDTKDTESQPFIEKPGLRAAKRGRWFLTQPPDDAGESQLKA